MRQLITVAIVVLWSGMAMAQDKAAPVKPEVPKDLQIDILKQESHLKDLQLQADALQKQFNDSMTALNASIAKAKESCGKDMELDPNAIACVDPPKPVQVTPPAAAKDGK